MLKQSISLVPARRDLYQATLVFYLFLASLTMFFLAEPGHLLYHSNPGVSADPKIVRGLAAADYFLDQHVALGRDQRSASTSLLADPSRATTGVQALVDLGLVRLIYICVYSGHRYGPVVDAPLYPDRWFDQGLWDVLYAGADSCAACSGRNDFLGVYYYPVAPQQVRS